MSKTIAIFFLDEQQWLLDPRVSAEHVSFYREHSDAQLLGFRGE
jgi:hypothetical protein